ncbi:SIMPL domain-containing protein [Lysobacter sp. Root690]|uniref:SIMPL domain-containing protein n=1 Tax=Lysobacter sp. Root690 TaxID=1736588 RepID=UPI00070168BF|nr:SIMPL domain-containing protein [Lysobacter sp. Root690]KRB03302.1 hypothetical protein ASD86_20660 [Lysobacter sp. Root690]
MNYLGLPLLAAMLWLSPPARAQGVDGGRFHVAGFGRVAYQPNLFELSFAVVSDAADASVALRQHQPVVAAVRQVVQAHRGELSELSVDAPRLTTRSGDESGAGYRYSTRFVLRVRGDDALALLQQQLSQAGVAEFESLRPLSDRLPEYADKARRLALQDAKRKAALIAAELGWTLDAATAVKFEDDRPWWTPQTPTARQYGARAYNYAAEAPAQTGEVTAQVDVEYRYSRSGVPVR